MSSSAAASAPLTEKCSICHKASRYKCPGCAARTCSAACSKRHKVLSMCSGLRDPTKYLRSEQLKTPAAFKNDLDLISSIERGLDDARRRLRDATAPEYAKAAAAQSAAQRADRYRAQRSQARRGRGATRSWFNHRGQTRPRTQPK